MLQVLLNLAVNCVTPLCPEIWHLHMSAWKPVNMLVIPVLLTLTGQKSNFSSSLFAFQWSSESITKGGNEGSNETPFPTSGSLNSLTYEAFLANLMIQPNP